MWTREADGSVIDNANGKIILFSTQRFVNDICVGDCCFICGARPEEKLFNNEHILPEWLLRRFNLFGRAITLPNGAAVQYDRYTVPCCAECNARMGDEVEQPISEGVSGGYDALVELCRRNPLAIATWMRLIFLKTHLKDGKLRFHLDKRKGQGTIGDLYDWEQLHHVHTFARCFYTDCSIQREALGLVLVLPVKPVFSTERFDFADNYLAQTLLVRLDDVALLTVFNDCGGAFSWLGQKIERFTGPVSDLQLREVFVELAWLNLHLKERPVLCFDIDLANEISRFTCELPDKPELKKLDYGLRGRLYEHALGHPFPYVRGRGLTEEETSAAVKAGKFTLLFDSEGKFITEADVVPREA